MPRCPEENHSFVWARLGRRSSHLQDVMLDASLSHSSLGARVGHVCRSSDELCRAAAPLHVFTAGRSLSWQPLFMRAVGAKSTLGDRMSSSTASPAHAFPRRTKGETSHTGHKSAAGTDDPMCTSHPSLYHVGTFTHDVIWHFPTNWQPMISWEEDREIQQNMI